MVGKIQLGDMRFCTAEGTFLFSSPDSIISIFNIDDVVPALLQVQSMLDKGYYAAGFIAYEAATAFDSALQCNFPDKNLPLLYFGIYKSFKEAAEQYTCANSNVYTPEWKPLITESEYNFSVNEIKTHIAAGNTYQVNYTFPLEADFQGDPESYFEQLRFAQGPPRNDDFRSLIHTERYSILSLSPEIFYTLDGNKIKTLPMKGTRRRGRYPAEDNIIKNDLLNSEKDRAENLMIADLLRNDLGKISENGTVETTELFTVHQWNTVWQMCSEIKAETHKNFPDIMTALFPSGSVTGAPKVSTMEIIKSLESWPRGIYCGTTGFIGPDRKACFSVAIRTVSIDRVAEKARYSIGSGITWYSSAEDEYRECLDKARMLSSFRPNFSLLETMRVLNSNIELLDLHLDRLSSSAYFFSIPLDIQKIKNSLNRTVIDSAKNNFRLRLIVTQDGKTDISVSELPNQKSLSVTLDSEPINSEDIFLFHKTTNRQIYKQALDRNYRFDDVILWNEKGEITETSIANIVIEKNGGKFTPPVSSGLLNGTFRQSLITQGIIQEQVILKEDLVKADNIFLINSVRGWIEIKKDKSCLTS